MGYHGAERLSSEDEAGGQDWSVDKLNKVREKLRRRQRTNRRVKRKAKVKRRTTGGQGQQAREGVRDKAARHEREERSRQGEKMGGEGRGRVGSKDSWKGCCVGAEDVEEGLAGVAKGRVERGRR